jgi:hypothetical protein
VSDGKRLAKSVDELAKGTGASQAMTTPAAMMRLRRERNRITSW